LEPDAFLALGFEGEPAQSCSFRIRPGRKQQQQMNLSLAAISDLQIGPVFASFDDVTLRLTPDSWISWDLSVLDKQAFGGLLGGTPGYLLPLD